MRLKLITSATVAAFTVFSASGDETKPGAVPAAPPDKEKLSYALGMNLGQRIKNSGVDTDVGVIAQAIKDVLAGKPTEMTIPSRS